MDPEGARLLTYSTLYAYGKPRLCINIHRYAPPHTVLQQRSAAHRAAAGRCNARHTHDTLHALRWQYTAQYREHLIR